MDLLKVLYPNNKNAPGEPVILMVERMMTSHQETKSWEKPRG